MKRNIRQAAAAFLLALSLLLSGCGIVIIQDFRSGDDSESAPAITTEPESPVTEPDPVTVIRNTAAYEAMADAYLDGIPEKDFDGAPYIITVPHTNVIDPDEAPDVHSSAKHERNRKVEARYNVSIVASAVEADSFPTLVQDAVQADEYYADLLMIPQYMIGTFAADDTLINLNSLPFLDLSLPYFDADSVEAATVGRTVYAAAGAASFEESTLTAAFFNRGLFEKLGLAVPYASVYKGSWTWDAFFALTSAVSDINAENETSYASYATQYAAASLPSAVFFSAGGRFVRSDGESAPMLAYTEEQADLIARIETLFSDKNAHGNRDEGVTKFYTGESLFLLDRLYLMTWMPNGSQNWGVLPLPKHSAEQTDYVSLADRESLFFASQKNNMNAERTAVILSALNAASYGVLSDAYITHSLHHIIRDSDTANMLDILIRSRTYDFSLSFGPTNSTLATSSYIGMQNLADGAVSFKTLCSRIASVNKQLAGKYPAG